MVAGHEAPQRLQHALLTVSTRRDLHEESDPNPAAGLPACNDATVLSLSAA